MTKVNHYQGTDITIKVYASREQNSIWLWLEHGPHSLGFHMNALEVESLVDEMQKAIEELIEHQSPPKNWPYIES